MAGERPPSFRPLRILGTGVARPGRWVESAELDARLGLPPGTVQRRSGVLRRGVEEQRNVAELGAEAARAALADAGLEPEDVDCVVCASASLDQAMPSNAALLHHELGLGARATPAFDVNASCLGFLVALDLAASLISSGRYARLLIVCADLASRALDFRDLDASAIFGDGAAAAVVAAGAGDGGLRAARFETYSAGAHLCEIPGGGTRLHPSRVEGNYRELCTFRMDGRALFRLVAGHFDRFVEGLFAEALCTLESVDLVVPHQASALGMQHVLGRLGLDPERVLDHFATHGNQVSASLPSALHEARAAGRLGPGRRAFLLGTGAGVTLGGLVLDL